MNAIYPVILAVPEADRRLRGREKVLRLSALARQAVKLSAGFSGICLGELMKSSDGVPLPTDGCHWSLSHKTEYVAGVAADFPIGLDIEKIKPCMPGLHRMLADDTEWKLGGGQDDFLFFRYWTAKEAVLKAMGIGLSGLSRCRIVRIVDADHLALSYDCKEYFVAHYCFNGHIAAVSAHPHIRWTVQEIADEFVNPENHERNSFAFCDGRNLG
jgi:4'-phosphopantetheinyl transferase